MLFLLFATALNFTEAQEPSQNARTFDDILETITDGLDEEADFGSMLEDLENYYENPMNINNATEDELKKLHLLNDFQIQQILDYRQKTGSIVSIFELNSLQGFNRELLEKAEPFISFEPGGIRPSADFGNRIRQELMIRSTQIVEKQKGFKPGEDSLPKYEGSAEKIYTRYKFVLGDKINAGITAEKDPGESFFSGSDKAGFDYYSAHISITTNSFIHKITLGDFIVQSGQGLVLWQGFAQHKPDDALNIFKNPQGIRPYTSTDENRFFRGLATTLKMKHWNLELFLSYKKRDANTEYADSSNHPAYFTSLQTSGYHRTENEIADERSLTETASGAVLTYRRDRFKLGTTFFYQEFNIPLVREDKPYNYFRFTGKENYNLGIDYYYVTGKYQFTGEAAVSKSGGIALIQGIEAHLHEQATLTFLFRHFDKDYHSPEGNAFAESSGNINETGLFAGINLLPLKNFRVTGCSDYYRSRWLTYTTTAPAGGMDFIFRLDYIPAKNIRLYFQLKNEKKEVKTTENEKYINQQSNTGKARIHFIFDPIEVIKFRSRFEYSFDKPAKENGIMAYQDILFIPKKIRLSAQVRFAFIHTDSYNTRIYAYENDLLNNFSIPAYYGKSFRAYLNTKYKITNWWEVWFKVSNTYYPGENTIGSGYNAIEGENITEVKIQFRFRF